MPLFKTNLKAAWAEGKRAAEAELERALPLQSAADLAAPLMQAFGTTDRNAVNPSPSMISSAGC